MDGLGKLANRIVAGPLPVSGELGAQPSESEEVVSTALGGDREFRGIRPPVRSPKRSVPAGPPYGWAARACTGG